VAAVLRVFQFLGRVYAQAERMLPLLYACKALMLGLRRMVLLTRSSQVWLVASSNSELGVGRWPPSDAESEGRSCSDDLEAVDTFCWPAVGTKLVGCSRGDGLGVTNGLRSISSLLSIPID
jgi:hypothetical protein